ncbi:hypothetical protein EC957_007932 [Mortierella hygrophila]|uniref:Ndc10 domain-containing protein n=1 Tax=Mortierella hygrophila TaxID=979708 RepID=A0A9P6JY54_9FUNG|nr:hypothetical protein EC957_007932 [Mortierella hygrophila]
MARDEVGKLAPSDMKIFHVKIDQCQKALDEREGARPVSTRGRVYYTLSNMVTALNVLWNGQGQRKDGRSFMEMFCISATHNMLLQDEELHQINFSDCFAVVPALNQQPGAQQCVVLTFKLKNSDPTSDADQKLYVSALRHYDLARCTFSAFAFYMFQIWQGATERDPRSERTLSDIFRDLGKDEWPSFKLLPSAGDPTASCPPTTVWAAIKKNFRYLGVTYPRKADDGCRVGTAEATKLKIPQSDIDDKGRWSVERGAFGECHVPQLLTAVPEGMAGFLDKPYSLARNGVSPPIPLQMLIFPWIEFAFGVDNAWWKQECLDEMNEVTKDHSTATTTPSIKASRKDSTKGDKAASRKHKRKAGDSKGKQVKRDDRDHEDGDDDDEAESAQDETHDAETESDAEYIPSAYSTPSSTAQEQGAGGSGDENGTADNDRQSPPVTFSEANKTKASFLRLLVRCRRIILQDAAYRLHRHQPNKILDNDIFRCTMFKSFQKEIGAATDKDTALNKKRPREKSPLTVSEQLQPNHAAGARSLVQREQQQQQQEQPPAIGDDPSTAELHHQQQEQTAAIAENPSTAVHHHQEQEQPAVIAENPSTAGHHHQQQEQPAVIAENLSAAGHHYQQQRHQQPALGALDLIGGEEPSIQPTSTSSYHHYQPRGQGPSSSTSALLEQQMLQLQHMVQTWSQKQEAQMQEMFSQHLKIHEMQQQMITTMMTALRTQQSPQMQFQYPPAGPSISAPLPPSSSSPPPHVYQPPNGVSSHADALGTIGDVTAAPATAGTSSSKLRHPQQEMYPL